MKDGTAVPQESALVIDGVKMAVGIKRGLMTTIEGRNSRFTRGRSLVIDGAKFAPSTTCELAGNSFVFAERGADVCESTCGFATTGKVASHLKTREANDCVSCTFEGRLALGRHGCESEDA